MNRLGLTQDDIGNVLHRDRSVVSRILSGAQPLKVNQVLALADALAVSPFEILFRAGMWGDRRPPPVRMAPILNKVEAGAFAEPPPMPSKTSDAVAVEYPRESVIALVVHGESMNRIAPNGSVVIVDYRERDLKDGQLGVFRQQNGEATFKRFRRSGMETWLEPESDDPRHQARIFPPEGQQIEVIGRVVDIRPEHPIDDSPEPPPPPRRPRRGKLK